MTKNDWYRAARDIYATAMSKDPVFADEAALAITGGTVFAWDHLTVRHLRALHRALFATARLS